jgi:hypothetical protein
MDYALNLVRTRIDGIEAARETGADDIRQHTLP